MLGVHVLEHRLERRRRRLLGHGDGVLDLRLDLGLDASACSASVQSPRRVEVAPQARDRIAPAPLLDLVVGAVGLGIVAGRVAATGGR